jgi:NAD(P)-dependent dehydrogenase (short-subunit alcohol dehydrogenase family)
MAGQFDGKVALVTGGNSGIGKATAMRFAEEGAKVVIAARRVTEGEQAAEEIRKAGGDAFFVKTDVSIEAEVEAMVSKTVEAYGRLDCVFNNAGISSAGSLIHESTSDEWDYINDINLKGVWLCMKYEIIQMLEQGSGAIVNNSSTAGLFGYANNPIYAATKFGVVGLTQSVALQYAQQSIRVNAVCPGWIRTPMVGDSIERETQALAETPMYRLGISEEIAHAVLWLCSDAASFVTGHAMPVDGGLVAQ